MRIPFFSRPPSIAHYDQEVASYKRLLKRGYRPSSLIDVGAYEGNWARAAWSVFGHVPTLLVEPQRAKHALLQKLCQSVPDCRLAPTVLSDIEGDTVTFYEMETGSSLLPERSNAPRKEVSLVTTTLDQLLFDHANTFLKIDAQGAELQILRGGMETLQRVSLVQLEAAVAEYNEGAPSLRQVLEFMETLSFSLLDISGWTRLQSHLVQVDLLFVPANSPLRPGAFIF